MTERIRHKHRNGGWCDFVVPRERYTRYDRDKIEMGAGAALSLNLAERVGTYHHGGYLAATSKLRPER